MKIEQDKNKKEVSDLDNEIIELIKKYDNETIIFSRLKKAETKKDCYSAVGVFKGDNNNLQLLLEGLMNNHQSFKIMIVKSLLMTLSSDNEEDKLLIELFNRFKKEFF